MPLNIFLYSRTGHATAAAGKISSSVPNTTIVSLETVKPVSLPSGILTTMFGSRTPLHPLHESDAARLAAPEPLVLLTPVWAGRVSRPMVELLATHKDTLAKRITDGVPTAICVTCGEPRPRVESLGPFYKGFAKVLGLPVEKVQALPHAYFPDKADESVHAAAVAELVAALNLA